MKKTAKNIDETSRRRLEKDQAQSRHEKDVETMINERKILLKALRKMLKNFEGDIIK